MQIQFLQFAQSGALWLKPLCLIFISTLLVTAAHAADPVKAHLTEELVQATMEYETAYEICEEAINESGNVTLPVSELAKRKVTIRELHFAIVYFKDKAQEACSSASRDKLIAAILNFHSYGATSPVALIDPERSGLSPLLPSHNLLEARVRYVQLKREKAELLKAIFEGRSPTLANISNWQEAANLLPKD